MKKGQVYLAVVLLFLGMMVAVQFRSTSLDRSESATRSQDLTARLMAVKEERDILKGEVDNLRKKLDEISSGKSGATQALLDELDKARMEAGLIPVSGRGVQVTLNDSPKELLPGENPNLYILHEEDLLKVVNELKAGGAEAISVNGQRLLAISEIRCAGNTILVNTRRIVPPIVILATGDPDTLSSGLQIKGGIFDSLKVWGLGARVDKKDDLEIPAYSGPIKFNYSKPVKG